MQHIQRGEKDISPSQIRPESSDWEPTRDTLPILTSKQHKALLPPAKSAPHQPGVTDPTVLFSNAAADTGSAVWPVKYRHNGVFDEQHHKTHAHTHAAHHRAVFSYHDDKMKATSGRRGPDITGSAAICKDDSVESDKENVSHLARDRWALHLKMMTQALSGSLKLNHHKWTNQTVS